MFRRGKWAIIPDRIPDARCVTDIRNSRGPAFEPGTFRSYSMKNRYSRFINPTTLIFCVSVVVFVSLLAVCRRMHPWLNVMDYYGYSELARNIFHRLDFTVRWELDAPLLYPPLFPILAHLMTFLTGDFVRSIEYINIFSASFCLVPLFLLVKNVLNARAAALSVVFGVCYFGLRPCYDPRSDQFFCFLFITICWYVWTIMNDKDQHRWKYVVAGVLLSLAYLAKYSGLFFLLAGAASIFWYFSRRENGRREAVRKVAFLFMGAAPLLGGYHLLALNSSRHSTVLSLSSYVFFDANAVYEGGLGLRERRMRELDPAGTEFAYVSFLKKNSPMSFSVKHPVFVFHKYVWGLKRVVEVMAARTFPLANVRSDGYILGLKLVFMLFLVIGAFRCRSSPGIAHILLFASVIAPFPLFHVFDERYLMPFIPLFFVLFLSGVDAVHRSADSWIRPRWLHKSLGIAFLVAFFCMYLSNGINGARRDYAAAKSNSQYEEFLETASWIRNDSRGSEKRTKIMSRYTAISYLTDSAFIILPYTLDWDTIIRFALSRGVDYIVIDKAYLAKNRPDQWRYFKSAEVPREHVQMMAESRINDNVIWIVKLAGPRREADVRHFGVREE
jgi:4-amino-4-deoxy-L-arabinose transferase-like glycosyltransferase